MGHGFCQNIAHNPIVSRGRVELLSRREMIGGHASRLFFEPKTMTDTPFATLATPPEVSGLSLAVDEVDRLDVRPLETTPLEKLTTIEKTAAVERIDGAGEPCPAPLVWQEIRENYLRESIPWELAHGPHRLTGRTWGVGRPLYFLNHYAGTAELFSLTAWLLKDHFRCVLFDTMTVAALIFSA